jgi:hypothetical protein
MRVLKVRLPPEKEAVNMNSESKPLKPFARSEREEPGEYLKECVNEGDEIYESLSHYVDGPRLVGYPDDQHALLMHYYRVAGIIEKTSRRSPMTLDEEIAAYNMFQQGVSVKEVAEKLNKNFVTIWRLVPKKEVLKYHHLNKYLVHEIDRLHALKTPYKEIARVLDLPERTVRYHLYEKTK